MQKLNGRFWEKIDKSNFQSCWLWIGAQDSAGYGNCWYKGKCYKSHRVAWELIKGPIPNGMHVLHKCDNPSCCNPFHLFLGTDADNMADRNRKGRQAWGSAMNRPDGLNEWLVCGIMARYLQGISCRQLAREFGISSSTAARIINGKIWARLFV